MSRFDKYLSALWSRNGLFGVVVVVLLAAALAWWFGIDVGGFVNRFVYGLMGAGT